MSDRNVKCPGCGAPMVAEHSKGVEIDRCPGCRGLWFDVGELARSVGKPLPPAEPKGPSPRGCPMCGTALGLTKMGRVDVDACTTCRGVYLDAGELSRLTPVKPTVAGRSARHAQATTSAASTACDVTTITLGILSLFG